MPGRRLPAWVQPWPSAKNGCSGVVRMHSPPSGHSPNTDPSRRKAASTGRANIGPSESLSSRDSTRSPSANSSTGRCPSGVQTSVPAQKQPAFSAARPPRVCRS